MSDRHRPFARTQEAAQQAEAKRVRRSEDASAPRRTFVRTAAVSPEAQPHFVPDGHGSAGNFTVNRLERRTMPRRRLPWLITAGVAVLFGQVVWWAYQEVDGEQQAVTTMAPVATVVDEAPPLTEVAFEPPVVDPPGAVVNIWPPIPSKRPTDGWLATVGWPPKPALKPR